MTTTVQAQQKNTPENKRIKKRNKKKLAGKERACCRVDAARQREAPAMQSINLYGAACGCLQCVCGGEGWRKRGVSLTRIRTVGIDHIAAAAATDSPAVHGRARATTRR